MCMKIPYIDPIQYLITLYRYRVNCFIMCTETEPSEFIQEMVQGEWGGGMPFAHTGSKSILPKI